jgi:hypothetical protein
VLYQIYISLIPDLVYVMPNGKLSNSSGEIAVIINYLKISPIYLSEETKLLPEG